MDVVGTPAVFTPGRGAVGSSVLISSLAAGELSVLSALLVSVIISHFPHIFH